MAARVLSPPLSGDELAKGRCERSRILARAVQKLRQRPSPPDQLRWLLRQPQSQAVSLMHGTQGFAVTKSLQTLSANRWSSCSDRSGLQAQSVLSGSRSDRNCNSVRPVISSSRSVQFPACNSATSAPHSSGIESNTTCVSTSAPNTSTWPNRPRANVVADEIAGQVWEDWDVSSRGKVFANPLIRVQLVIE